MEGTNPLKNLYLADPETAKSVEEKIKNKIALTKEQALIFTDEVIWALSEDRAFGSALVEGYISLFKNANPDKIHTYKKLVRKAGETGPTLGRIMAEHLVSVLLHGDETLLGSFLGAVYSMRKKGTYTLAEPLEAVTILLDKGEIKACSVYLEILESLFAKNLTYGECRHFAHLLPKAVLSFPPLKRTWQAEQLYRIILEDYQLADPFLEGMEKGLSFLLQDALKEFVSIGLEKIRKEKQSGIKYLSLDSRSGVDTLMSLQTAVPLSGVRLQLTRYVRAKTGTLFSICPLSQMPKNMRQEVLNEHGGKPFVFSCVKFIYLPDEISLFGSFDENRDLYKCLVRLEAGYHEFNSYEFDFERALHYSGCLKDGYAPERGREPQKDCSDLEKFFELFAVKDLAADLFNIFEQGRLRVISMEKYPGLVRISYPLLFREAGRIWKDENPEPLLFLLYMRIALGKDPGAPFSADVETIRLADSIYGLFEKTMEEKRSIEKCA
ncbi:MAG: nitric oxide reductase NorD protein [Thermodesulfobacteriota bacterium]|nr:nitric oxide reductase NorD protein [Thermodesulfobacteriota bacterium]